MPVKKIPAPVAHPLAHRIPGPEAAERYTNRQIGNVKDTDLMAWAKDTQRHVLLSGPTGPGKTSMIRAYCSERSIPLVTINANGGIDPNTFFGMPRQNPTTGIIEWVDSEIMLVIKHGGMLFIDEVNFMHPKVAATLHPLTDARRAVTVLENNNELVVASPDLQIAAAYNPDYEGTRQLNAAFKNRFAIKLPWGYDEKVEATLVCMPVLREIAGKLRKVLAEGDLETPISTNMLMEMEEIGVDLGLDFAIANFVAAFHEDEKQAVREIFTLHGTALAAQFKQLEDMAEEDMDDE